MEVIGGTPTRKTGTMVFPIFLLHGKGRVSKFVRYCPVNIRPSPGAIGHSSPLFDPTPMPEENIFQTRGINVNGRKTH